MDSDTYDGFVLLWGISLGRVTSGEGEGKRRGRGGEGEGEGM